MALESRNTVHLTASTYLELSLF